MEREIVVVAARGRDGCIARNGEVPWRIREDLQRFVRHTTGKVMVMGRTTFDSLPELLPGRRHIVLTLQQGWQAEGAEVAHSVDEALRLAGEAPIAVIGGAQIYALFEPLATRLEITAVDADTPGCDTFMPAPDPSRWREVRHEGRAASERHPPFAFVTYERTA